MPRTRPRLSHAELAALDALIVFAQQRGYVVDDDDDPPSGAAETIEARHNGILRLIDEQDRAVLGRLRRLARNLDGPSTLRELINLRGQAIRGR